MFYSRVHHLYSIERTIGCLEFCLHQRGAGTSDGCALLVYTVGPRGSHEARRMLSVHSAKGQHTRRPMELPRGPRAQRAASQPARRPGPREAAETLESLLAVLGEGYRLSPIMHILLAKTLSTARRRIHRVLRALEERAEAEPARDVRNSIYALQQRPQAPRPVLELLEPGPGKKLDPAEPRPRPLLYLAVEEAHNTTAPATPMEQLLLEARKKNTRLILASHPASHIHNLHTITQS